MLIVIGYSGKTHKIIKITKQSQAQLGILLRLGPIMTSVAVAEAAYKLL